MQDGTTLGGPSGFGSSGYSSAALPLASIGKQVGWKIAPDDFRVFVPQAAGGRNIALEVFSPEINRNDYANGRDRRTYYGDELYGKTATLKTNFNLSTANQQVLVNRTFGEGLKHSFEQLVQSALLPGFYPLTIQSDGNGKNSYAIRLTGGARIEASQFTVNARGQFNQDQVAGFVQIDASQLGKTVRLENYDADGDKEIVLTLVTPKGKRVALKASEDTQWASNSFVVTPALVGTWKILARILPTTRQFSNAFVLRLRVEDKPLYAQLPGFGVAAPPIQAIRCEVVDLSGAPIVGATCVTTGAATRTLSPVLPACYNPVSAAVLSGVGIVVSPTQVDITSPSGAVRFVADCPPAKLQVSVVALVCGARVPLSNISVNVGGQVVTAPTTVEVKPGQVSVGANVVGAITPLLFVTAERGQTKVVTLEIAPRLNLAIGIEGPKPNAGGLSVSTSMGDVRFENPVSSLEIGDTATVVAIASTPFTQTLTQTISVALPVGLEATGPVRVTGSLVSGTPLILRIPARATAAISDAQVSATLEPSCNVQAVTPLTINSQPVVIPPPAKLELTKTVDRIFVKPGEQPMFTIAVTNTGGSVAKGVRLTDALPAGLRGTNVDQTFDLEPGASKTVTLEAVVEDSASGVIVNTANVNWNGADLTASAQVRVQPVIDLSIKKTVSVASVQLGEGAVYSLLVTNTGPSAATNVVVSDALPAGLTYVSSSASQGSSAFANGVVTANLGSLAKAASATITVRVTTTRAGSFTNTATVAGSEEEITLANNRSSAVLEVIAPPVVVPPPPVVIPNGTLSVTSSANVCGATQTLSGTGFTLNGQRYSAPATVSLAPGNYTVQPDALSGSTANPVAVTIASNQTVSANLVYNVALSLSLDPATVNMVAGQTTTLTATASTAFPYPVGVTIDITIPETFTTTAARTLTGTVAAGKPLTLTVPVRATQNVTGAVVRSNLQSACGISDSSLINVGASALPDQFRESNVVLLAQLSDVPTQRYVAQSNALILSDRVPANATYVKGSSRLLDAPTFDVNTPTNAPGSSIADPFVSGDRLFWIIPLKNGVATLEALQSSGQITMRRDNAGRNVYGVGYKLAHTGALVMPADRIAVIAAIPSSRTAAFPRGATIAPDSALAKLIGTGDLIVLQGDNSILIPLAQAVQFNGQLSSAAATPALMGGPATTVRVSIARPTTDSVDQPQIVVEAFDANGLPANDAFATLEASVDILDPDADPETTGYQVRLTSGVGKVRVANLSGGNANANANPIGEVRVEARVSNANGVISSSQKFTASSFTVLSATASSNLEPATTNTSAVLRPFVGAGTLGLGGSLDLGTGAFTANGGLRYFLRGELASGLLLTLGINWQAAFDATTGNFSLSGNLMPSANPYDRFPLLGDSSILGSDVRSTEGLYFRIETGSSYLLFGQFNPSFRGTLSAYSANYNGFQGVLRDGGFNVNAFISDVPNADQRFVARADGSDLYFLPSGGIGENSERIVVVTRNRFTNQKLTSRVLTRNVDYSIDYLTGIVRLRQAVLSTDNDLNPVFVEFDFAATGVKRDLRAGAQVSVGGDNFKVTGTALQFRNGQFGANGSYLFGAGIALNSGGFNANVEAALSGQFGNQGLGLAAQASYVAPNFAFSVDYRDRDQNFVNPESNQLDSGRALTAGLLIGDVKGFRINGQLLHTQEYTGGTGSTGASLEARTNLGSGFTAALGFQYLYSFPVSSNELWLTGGLAVPLGGLKLTLDGRTPLLGTVTTYGGITAGVELALSDRFSLRLADKLTFEWNGIRQQLSFGVTGAFANSEILRGAFGNDPINPDAFGVTSVSATYELDSLDGNSGRARVGLETLVPLGGAFSAQLGAEAVFDPKGNLTGSTSVGLLYAADSVKGLARAQLSLQPAGLKQVYTLSVIAPLSPEFIVSPLIEYAVDPSRWATPGALSADGGRYSIALALRSDDWSVLSNNTGRFGLYAPNGDFLEGEVQAGYQAAERLYFRSSIAYRYQFTGGTFTGQVGAGFSYFLTDGFAVGAQAGYLFNTLGSSKFAFGVEGSLRVVDNLLFTLGVNALGFNGIGNSFNPGLYFRLDWKLDERTFGFGGSGR